MSARTATAIFQYFGMSLLVPAVLLLGVFVGGMRHADDYRNGWSDGYAAHVRLIEHNDATLKQAGICTYARLACACLTRSK
jgi:hypothetical protein